MSTIITVMIRIIGIAKIMIATSTIMAMMITTARSRRSVLAKFQARAWALPAVALPAKCCPNVRPPVAQATAYQHHARCRAAVRFEASGYGRTSLAPINAALPARFGHVGLAPQSP